MGGGMGDEGMGECLLCEPFSLKGRQLHSAWAVIQMPQELHQSPLPALVSLLDSRPLYGDASLCYDKLSFTKPP